MADGDGKFKAGPGEAAKMLEGLDPQAQKRIMQYLERKDPRVAAEVKDKMITFEDLQYLTPKMLMEFLREVDRDKLALALRIGSESLRVHFLSNVSSSMRKDIEEVLNGKPCSVNDVQDCVDYVMNIATKMLEKGQLIINKNSDDYV